MEQDFARLLRSMTNEQANGASSANEAWEPELQESEELEAALHERAQARLAAVTAALRRFDTGAYGECARCGRRISFGRLAAMPEATLCIACGGT
jgi:RNA polymerase-binding transcription factor